MELSERSDHEDALAHRVGDGGGCVEAAQAAADLRNETDTAPAHTRRSVLTTMAGLGASTLVPDTDQPTTAPPAGVDPDDIKITPIAGRLRTLWIKYAINQDTVQLVGNAISDDGYSFYREDAEVLYVRGRAIDKAFFSVYLRGEHDADPENTTGLVVWSQNDEIDTTAIGIAHVDHSGDGTNDHYQVSQYNLMGESLAMRSQAMENFGGCDDVRWDCVARIAGSYAAMYGSCAICASSLTPPTCAVCLGAVGFHLASQHCPWCRD